jgi:hypothetical protein
MATVLLSGVAFAEFNLKTGYDLSGTYKVGSTKFDVASGFTISGDYLRRIIPAVGIGGGFEIPIPRTYKDHGYEYDDAFWFLPLYLTVQGNPIPPVPELFVKANIGYNVVYLDSNYDLSGHDNTWTGGVYYAFTAGYEFPFGLLFDVTYAVYNGEIKQVSNYYPYPEAKADVTYTRFGINIGYKFGRPRR